MVRDIQEFVCGNMNWEDAADLVVSIAKSDEWFDYLLTEMERLERLTSQ